MASRGPPRPVMQHPQLIRLPPGAPPPPGAVLVHQGHPGVPHGAVHAPQGQGAGAALELRLREQQREIQQLLAENQRLAATHVALRQELAAAQGEIQRSRAAITAVQIDKEQAVRAAMDQKARLEEELHANGKLVVSSTKLLFPAEFLAGFIEGETIVAAGNGR